MGLTSASTVTNCFIMTNVHCCEAVLCHLKATPTLRTSSEFLMDPERGPGVRLGYSFLGSAVHSNRFPSRSQPELMHKNNSV